MVNRWETGQQGEVTAERAGAFLGKGVSLSTEAVVAAQEAFVLLVRAELDGGVGHHTHHGGRVTAPQAPEAFVEVGEVEEPEGLLGAGSGEGNVSRLGLRPSVAFARRAQLPSQLA